MMSLESVCRTLLRTSLGAPFGELELWTMYVDGCGRLNGETAKISEGYQTASRQILHLGIL